MRKLFIEDLELAGKRVLVRLDYNVPGDDEGNVTNDARITASLPTLHYILAKGASAVLCSHRSRPKGDEPRYSLRPVAARLEELMGLRVRMARRGAVVSDEARNLAASLEPGELMMLENLRYDPREQQGRDELARELASLADLFVNDAFPVCHRKDTSVVGVPKFLTSAYGYQLREEVENLSLLLGDVQRPYVGIMGGAKISTKLGVVKSFLGRVDRLLVGGGIAYTFLAALGKEVGGSIHEPDYLEYAKDLLLRHADKIVLPTDNYVVERIDPACEPRLVEEIPADRMAVDIGDATRRLFAEEIARARTVFWNGPVGYFEDERFAEGTRMVAREVAKLKDAGAFTVVGGGDSVAAVEDAGLDSESFSFVSTGGGASLVFVQGKELPGIEALTDR
ncbi:MAG TPA: phosphoglycerate kinase [bacterium]|nr:phosphoglycerate kinase [bacterium]